MRKSVQTHTFHHYTNPLTSPPHLKPHSLHQRSPALSRSIPNQSTQHAKVRRIVVRLAGASIPVPGLIALEHRVALLLRADVVGQAAGLDERGLVFGEAVLGHLVRMDVAWGRENGGHGEGGDADGEEEGGEIHCRGLGGGVVDVIEQTGLATWE